MIVLPLADTGNGKRFAIVENGKLIRVVRTGRKTGPRTL